MYQLKSTDPILVFIGPSGSGKSRIVRELMNENIIELHKTWTTRPKREDEAQASEHEHVSEAEFDHLCQKDFFVETVQLFDLPYSYGLPKITTANQSKIASVMLRASVLDIFHKHYTNTVIYQIDVSRAQAEARMKKRGDSSQEIKHRLAAYDKEVALGREKANRYFLASQNINELAAAIKASIITDFD